MTSSTTEVLDFIHTRPTERDTGRSGDLQRETHTAHQHLSYRIPSQLRSNINIVSDNRSIPQKGQVLQGYGEREREREVRGERERD